MTELTQQQYVDMVDNSKVYEAAIETDLDLAKRMSNKTGTRVYLKREDTQPVFSFKVRGAANKVFSLSNDQISNGVICSSAGNHAQGVALAARVRNVPAHIVMPASAPRIKVEAVEALGAKVTLFGASYDETQAKAFEIAKASELEFIHPFNDPEVIAGQGTIGKEILSQLTDIAAIFVPIGGGGLAAGISTYVKAKAPHIKIVGVEPTDCASMRAAIKAGKPVPLDSVGTFADGVAVKQVGDESFRLCNQYLDEIITVDTDQTCAGIQEIFEDTRTVVEPAGALAAAAITKYYAKNPVPTGNVVAIACGANMNFDRLRHVGERAAIGAGREALLAVKIPEEPGSFLKFCQTLGTRNVTEFNYRLSDPADAQIFLGVETSGEKKDQLELLAHLANAGYAATDLTDSELAKLHIRHLAAGSGQASSNEHIYRFRFPERAGALLEFLTKVGDQWNITLFHYRNHGSDFGRVMVGVDIPPETRRDFVDHIDQLGYEYSEETQDPAYQLLLK